MSRMHQKPRSVPHSSPEFRNPFHDPVRQTPSRPSSGDPGTGPDSGTRTLHEVRPDMTVNYDDLIDRPRQDPTPEVPVYHDLVNPDTWSPEVRDIIRDALREMEEDAQT